MAVSTASLLRSCAPWWLVVSVATTMADPNNPNSATDALGTNVQRLFLNFLEEYRDEATAGADGLPSSQGEATYVRALRELKEADRSTLFVDFNHLLECVHARGSAGR